ncbi:transcriptional regulator SdiA [Entomohabitans teleogrylli]|uniref:transcriptional regulator SdiA n=1 Tax=Entomohabitans teleogrylli TaxID=1384589 RepID=UPI00073D53B3|nr:transcriptional regulator SdiA [Entomohabitans teleogrylli]
MQGSNFFTWRQEMAVIFNGIDDAGQIFAAMRHETELLDFDYFAFCIRQPIPFTRPRLTVHTTYPAAWREVYQAENYFAIDPVMQPCNAFRGLLAWNDELFANAKVFWGAAQDHGLCSGYTRSLTGPQNVNAFLSVALRNNKKHRMAEEEISMRLQYLNEIGMASLLRLQHDSVAVREMRLSKREREILQWTAEGKTSAEIAIILSISENTVNFHQKNMQKKFEAPNKTQIASYAAALGLI